MKTPITREFGLDKKMNAKPISDKKLSYKARQVDEAWDRENIDEKFLEIGNRLSGINNNLSNEQTPLLKK